VRPAARKHEILGFLERGLADFSVSRPRARARGWGIPVPGDPEQVVYVWFDALANYISALGYAGDPSLLERYWTPSTRRTHVIGKGILRFHAAYWPAILLSAGLELPSELLVHGYVTVEGRKIGKSLGNAVDPFELIRKQGRDAFRYYVLRQLHTTADSDFSEARLTALRASELADQLGNLLRRTLVLVQQRCPGRAPSPGELTSHDAELRALGERATFAQNAAFDRFDLNSGSAEALAFVSAANRYIDAQAPWSLKAPHERARLEAVLCVLLDALCHAAWLLAPIIPETSERIHRQLENPALLEGPLFPK